jgi:hypothetical protein
VSYQDEHDVLREENESLAEFLLLLQREHRQLKADFAAVLHAAGGHVRVAAMNISPDLAARRIERLEDPDTGAVTFRLQPIA